MIGEGEFGDGDGEEVPPLGEVRGFDVEGDMDEALDVLDGHGLSPKGGVGVGKGIGVGHGGGWGGRGGAVRNPRAAAVERGGSVSFG